MEYERKTLLPYLTELYGIEVTYRTLVNKSNLYNNAISHEKKCASNAHILDETIAKPNIETPEKNNSRVMLVAAICFTALLSIWIFIQSQGYNPLSVFLFYLIIALLIIRSVNKKAEEDYERALDSYNSKMANYQSEFTSLENQKATVRKSQEILPTLLANKQEIDTELEACIAVRDNAYSLNVIPSDYRDLGPVAYLFNYFSTSQATNLDQVIQTMLLDDIRRRIQNIENQLNEIISNQQRIYNKLSEIQDTAQEIGVQLVEMESLHHEQLAESQKQTDELKMIKTSARISNYLQAGTYLKVANM